MKRGDKKLKEHIRHLHYSKDHLWPAFFLVFIILFSVLSMVFFTKTDSAITGEPISESVGISASVSNAQPIILDNNLDGRTNVALLAGGIRQVDISFRVQDNNGYNDIDVSSLNTFASISRGGVVRQSPAGSCTKVGGGTPKRADIICSVPMHYYDESASDWVVSVSVGDTGGLAYSDSSRTIAVDMLRDITIQTTPPSVPAVLTFTSLAPGTNDQAASNDPLVVTNNGNYAGPVVIDAHQLTNGIDSIPVSSFSAHRALGQECLTVSEGGSATQLSDAVNGDIITSTTLPRGEAGSNTETIFICADTLPDPLSSGNYESSEGGVPVPWIVMLP